jgi:hypothetical protein
VKQWALILLFAAGLPVAPALADAPDLATQPSTELAATAPSALVLSPATEPVTIAPASAANATTEQSSPQSAGNPGAATQPTATAVQPTTGPSTQPATAPVATTGSSIRPSEGVASAAPGSGDHRDWRASTSSRPASRILPGEFMILAERSIFQKGSHVTRRADPDQVAAPPPAPATAPTASSKSDSPEESLVFDGATVTGNQILAFVEDRGDSKMLVLQDGDVIARGKITGISLDTLDYTTAGEIIHVQVGQNLRGEEAQAVSDGNATAAGSPTSAAPGGAGTSPGAAPGTGPGSAPGTPPPPGAAPAPGGSGGGADDVVARLRARRARELGQ